MKLHQKILTGVLLILIGMVAGSAFMVYQAGMTPFIPTEVQVTEVKRSAAPTDLPNGDFGSMPAFSIRDVAREVVPTVVYIETSVSSRNAVPDDGNHNFEEDFWERFSPRGRSSAVGSGVIISDDGFILTNNHVVAGGRSVRVTLHDKRQFDARIIGRDPSTDLAVLKIEGENLPSIVLGDSDYIEVGDWVMAVGNPLRLRSTITAGIVSALGRDVQIIRDQMRIENFIQTDAAINKGNSGGALVNTNGELIGINTAIATESGMNQGYGFAIPINMAFKIGRDLMEFGSVQRAYLGIQILEVDQRRARELGLDNIQGVEVAGLVTGGAAENHGIESGDVIFTINNMEVNEPNQLQARVAMFRPDDVIEVTIWRSGEILQKQIQLAGLSNQAISEWSGGSNNFQEFDLELPEPNENDTDIESDFDYEDQPDTEFDTEQSPEPASIQFDQGFTVEILEIEAHRQLGIQIKVSDVRRFSAARRAGLRANDIILSVNGVRISGLYHLKEKIDEAEYKDKLSIMVIRDSEVLSIDF